MQRKKYQNQTITGGLRIWLCIILYIRGLFLLKCAIDTIYCWSFLGRLTLPKIIPINDCYNTIYSLYYNIICTDLHISHDVINSYSSQYNQRHNVITLPQASKYKLANELPVKLSCNFVVLGF